MKTTPVLKYVVPCVVMATFLLFPIVTTWADSDSVVSLRLEGGVGDGSTDNAALLERILAGMNTTPGVLLIDQGIFAVSHAVIPKQVTLRFGNSGAIHIPKEGVLELHGGLEAGLNTVFHGEGSVTGNAQVPYVYPQWFGARGDGEADDSLALQRAADFAVSTMGRTLFVPAGDYRFDRDVILRCHVECRGRFIKVLEIDESKTQFSNDLFLPTHHPVNNPSLRFESDEPLQELEPEGFFGIQEGDLKVPCFKDVPLVDGSGTIDLAPGGVLVFHSTDFFSSRNVRKGDHFYERNDICQVVSGLGDVFPEFAFSYDAPPDAPPWNAETRYKKGDYCSYEDAVFKATYPSGPETAFHHRHFGEVEIGPVQPLTNETGTRKTFQYKDGPRDTIQLWQRIAMRVWYCGKDVPVTVNDLRVEVRLINHGGETKRIAAGAVSVSRSNMTLNRPEITVRDREATLSQLFSASRCVNMEVNNGYFSGATSAHLGYNILNSNVAHFRYNHCVSTNSRKGMDGRHGKNITVNGGHYNVINDHYGRNYVIRDVTLSCQSVSIPNDSTPSADLQAWAFRPRGALGFNGANIYVQNVTVAGGQAGLFSVRSDIGDLYGDIVLRDIFVHTNDGDVQVFSHRIADGFDYAHPMKSPGKLVVENVRLENPGRLHFNFGSGFGTQAYGPVTVSQCDAIGNVFTAGGETRFTMCSFRDSLFTAGPGGKFHFLNCLFEGNIRGLDAGLIGHATGNIALQDATIPFPLNYLDKERYTRIGTPEPQTHSEK